MVSIPLQQLPFSVSPHVHVVTDLANSVCCRMPASGTMVAPFGRVMSGRGFAPGSFQLHDIPSAGQFTKDLPIVGNKPNIDVWLQQAKTADSMQLLGKAFLNSSVRPVVRGEPRLPELQVQAVLLSRCILLFSSVSHSRVLLCLSVILSWFLLCLSVNHFQILLRCVPLLPTGYKHASTLVNHQSCHVWHVARALPLQQWSSLGKVITGPRS